MKLEFIALEMLCVSKTNMRHGRKAPDVSDILPTVRARGVIQPILVRPNCQPGHYEIVAGSRRFHAARIVAEENGAATGEAQGSIAEAALLPCAILDEGDDADAVEASLIENIARLDPDEMTQWECFTRLIREGRKVEEIAANFGLPDLAVKRVLALGNLLPRIRDLYRREEIDVATVRQLTLASKRQQRDWLTLLDDTDAYAPRGYQLKSWILGGQTIPVSHALFPLEGSGLATVSDLFGQDSYFTCGKTFWSLQNAAVEARRRAYLEQGWTDAVVIGPDSHFHSWEYEKMPKRKGGRVYLDVRPTGEIVIHEGYLSCKEAARLARGEAAAGEGGKPARPEMTSVTRTYVDLHRHAAVRAALLGHIGLALRLMVAHAIAGSPLWSVRVEPQTARHEATGESIDECRAETRFDEKRRTVLAALGFEEDEPTVIGSSRATGLNALLARLIVLPDGAVMDVLAIVMGETLAAGSPVIELLGQEMNLSMADWWEADEAFLETLRDREVLRAMVAEVAGEMVASANAKQPGKVLKGIIRDHLAGAGGRTKREHWVPRWMAFPPSAYTERGGVSMNSAADEVDPPDCAIADEPDDINPVELDGEHDGNLKAA